MKIEQVTRFMVDGKEFPSLAKAQDYVESLVDKILKNQLINAGFSASESFKLSQIVLANRDFLAEILSCRFEEDNSDD